MASRFAATFLLLSFACAPQPPKADPGTQVSMNFARGADFYAAPFPSDDLVQADGSIDISGFPDPQQVTIVEQVRQMITTTARGYAQSGGVFFEMSDDLDATKLPTLAQSVKSGATVFLVGVGSSQPDFMTQYPVKVAEATGTSLFGPTHMLSVLPLQGIPLRPASRYAAVVLRSALDTTGKQLGRSLVMAQLAAGVQPAGLSKAVAQEYIDAIQALGKHGIAADTIAGIAVFTTDAPQATFAKVVDAMKALPTPVPGSFTLAGTYSNFCEFTSTVSIPDYQQGTPPFSTVGGNWAFDSNGNPIFQRNETAEIVVTVPQSTMPTNGYPAVVFIPAGGGTALPLVDRGLVNGVQDAPGNGPATEYAKVGFAGASVDGPEDGMRNTTGNPNNEDNLYFNFINPPALRDNIREAAAEVVLHAHILANLSLDATGCPGAVTESGSTMIHFDSTKFVVQGHSMGASIGPLPAAYEPLYRAMIVDGAGASYIENIEFKVLPMPILPLAEAYLGYQTIPLLENDPIMTMVQWAAEPSDSLVFARNLVQEPLNGSAPRDILMFQGVIDHYIMPTIANALTLSLGIDLAGPDLVAGVLDGTVLAGPPPTYTSVDTPVTNVLAYSGRSNLPLPASNNFNPYTAVLTQDPGDGVEDGHEMMFQTEAPKNQYRCFLQTYAAGLPPTVPLGSATTCP